MTTYKVTLESEGETQSFNCADHQNILDAADKAGIDLPYSCSAGACSTCCGKILDGGVDQSEQCFLSEDQLRVGYALLCVSYPVSDVVIKPKVEEDLY